MYVLHVNLYFNGSRKESGPKQFLSTLSLSLIFHSLIIYFFIFLFINLKELILVFEPVGGLYINVHLILNVHFSLEKK